jgi:tetratricopeptide (TPR) repeat protein
MTVLERPPSMAYPTEVLDVNPMSPSDGNEARRRLRAVLLDFPREPVPHSHDTPRLVAVAQSLLARRLPAEARRRLRTNLALVLNLTGREAEARELLEEALAAERGDDQRGFLQFLLATQIYLRRGEFGYARELLVEAIAAGGLGRRLRAWVQFDLARAHHRLGHPDLAEAAAREGMSMRVNEALPALTLVLASVAHGDQRPDEGRRRLARARRLYRSRRDERGYLRCDALLATWLLESGDLPQAIELLQRVGAELARVLDLDQLAQVNHNLGVAFARSDSFPAALDAYTRAIRLHVETAHLDRALGSLTSAAGCYERMGQVERAVALHHVGADLASDAERAAQEFRSTTEILRILVESRSHLRAVPYLLTRARSSLDVAAPNLTADEILRLVRLTARMGQVGAPVPRREKEPRPRDFPRRSDLRRAEDFVRVHMTSRLERDLLDRIAERLPSRWEGRATDLAGFLLTWTGTWFRNRDYQREFGMNQGSAKHQLRELRTAGLIAQQGIKKGARYHLDFQDPADLVARGAA